MFYCICGTLLTFNDKFFAVCDKCKSITLKKGSDKKYNLTYQNRGLGLFKIVSLLINKFESLYFNNIFKGKEVLDFGCGDSSFCNYYRRKGVSINGYDPYFKNDIKLLNRKYDVITCFHVLEHVSKPIVLLKRLHKLLNPGGILIIRTPAANSLEFLLASSSWFHLDYPFHKFIFSYNCLVNILKEVGFTNPKKLLFFDYLQTLGYSISKSPSTKIILGIFFVPLSFFLRFFNISPCINISTRRIE